MSVPSDLFQLNLGSCSHWILLGYSDCLSYPVTQFGYREGLAHLSTRLHWPWPRLTASARLPYHICPLGFAGALQFIKHYPHLTMNLPVGSSTQAPTCLQGSSSPSTQDSELGGQISHLRFPKTLIFPRCYCMWPTFSFILVLRQWVQPLP